MNVFTGIEFKVYLKIVLPNLVQTWNGAHTDDDEPIYINERLLNISAGDIDTKEKEILYLGKLNSSELNNLNKEIKRLEEYKDTNQLISNKLNSYYTLREHIEFWLLDKIDPKQVNTYRIDSSSGVPFLYVNDQKTGEYLTDNQKRVLEFFIENKEDGKSYLTSDDIREIGIRFENLAKIFKNNKEIFKEYIIRNRSNYTYRLK